MVTTGQINTQPAIQTPQATQQQTQSEIFQKYIEVEVLKIIKILAESGQTTTERIQDIANNTLLLIQPGMSMEELYRNAIKLDDTFAELAPVVMKVMREYEEKYNKKAVEQVSQLIKEGQLDQAQDVVKKVLLYKMSQ